MQAAMATPLLLVVHGRAGGVIPAELERLAAELTSRRGTPVLLQALTAEQPRQLPSELNQVWAGSEPALTLVPLMLLPGAHVRQDIPAIAGHWRSLLGAGVVRSIPFVGAWPHWQQALAEAVANLRVAAPPETSVQVLHHPLDGVLGARFLAHLAQVSGARLQATPYSADHLAALNLSLTAPALPLALAANRLTDQLLDRVGPPLLQRERFRRVLVNTLKALP